MIFMLVVHLKLASPDRYSALKWKCQYGGTGCVTLNNIVTCIYTAGGNDHKMQCKSNFICMLLKTSSKSGAMAMCCIIPTIGNRNGHL